MLNLFQTVLKTFRARATAGELLSLSIVSGTTLLVCCMLFIGAFTFFTSIAVMWAFGLLRGINLPSIDFAISIAIFIVACFLVAILTKKIGNKALQFSESLSLLAILFLIKSISISPIDSLVSTFGQLWLTTEVGLFRVLMTTLSVTSILVTLIFIFLMSRAISNALSVKISQAWPYVILFSFAPSYISHLPTILPLIFK